MYTREDIFGVQTSQGNHFLLNSAGPKILPQWSAKHCKPETAQLSDQASISMLFECLVWMSCQTFQVYITVQDYHQQLMLYTYTDVCVHCTRTSNLTANSVWCPEIMVPVMRGLKSGGRLSKEHGHGLRFQPPLVQDPSLGLPQYWNQHAPGWVDRISLFVVFRLVKRQIADALQTMPPWRLSSNQVTWTLHLLEGHSHN